MDLRLKPNCRADSDLGEFSFVCDRGERYGFLNTEAMLFDKDGRPLVFTEPRRVLDGDWELCKLDGDKYIVSIFGV